MKKSEGKYTLTPWGCMSVILSDYGYDPNRLTPTMGGAHGGRFSGGHGQGWAHCQGGGERMITVNACYNYNCKNNDNGQCQCFFGVEIDSSGLCAERMDEEEEDE